MCKLSVCGRKSTFPCNLAPINAENMNTKLVNCRFVVGRALFHALMNTKLPCNLAPINAKASKLSVCGRKSTFPCNLAPINAENMNIVGLW